MSEMTLFHPDDRKIVLIRSIRVGTFAAPPYVFYVVFHKGLKWLAAARLQPPERGLSTSSDSEHMLQRLRKVTAG